MAKTSKYGFIPKRHLLPAVGIPAVLSVILANSAGPLTIGDAVTYASGYLNGAAIDVGMLGILVGFVDKNGNNIYKTNATPVTGTKSGDDTYTAASNNQTVDQVMGEVYIDTMELYLAYADGTLAQSDVGTWFNGKVNDGTYIDGVTIVSKGAWSVGTQQFQLIELVTTLDDGTASTTTGLFRIGRSVLLNDVTVGNS